MRNIALLALLGGCLVAAGCGADEEGDPIPAESAATLQSQLNSIESRIAGANVGACEDITGSDDPNTEPVQQAIDGLPGEVDQDVRDALQQGFDRLFELVQERCAELSEQQETDTGTTPASRRRRQRPRPSPPRPSRLPPTTETTPTGHHEGAHHADGSPGRAVGGRRRGRAGRRHPRAGRRRRMSPPSQVAHRYVIESRLGAGGMSTVFKANDTVLERPVAVKLLAEHLADDEAFVARFRREALSAARLQHPNIVQVFDSGQDPESQRHYIVMEYVDGPSCANLLREQKELEYRRHRAGGARRLPRPRLRAPCRRHPPRRQAREPAGYPGEFPHQAGRLRYRQGGRADADHAGGLHPGDRGLSLARAGTRRRGGTRVATSTPSGCAPTSSWPAGCRTSTPR